MWHRHDENETNREEGSIRLAPIPWYYYVYLAVLGGGAAAV